MKEPVICKKCGLEMVELQREEWPPGTIGIGANHVYRCPICFSLSVFGDWPGPS